MAKFELLTNEWLPAGGNKWPKREALCRFSDGWKEVLVWNGYYWVDQNDTRVEETVEHRVVAFYIFEKYNENDIIE